MTKIIAHSGCDETVPGSKENLLTALKLGADIIEVDLRLYKNEVYLSHNPLQFNLIGEYLTLSDAIEVLKPHDVIINCDLKEMETFPFVLQTLKEYDMEHRTIFTGEYPIGSGSINSKYKHFFNAEHTEIVSKEYPISKSAAEKLVKYYRECSDNTLAGYNIKYTTLTDDACDVFKQAEIPISCWTVDDESEIIALLNKKLSYITTNKVAFTAKIRYETIAMV